MNEISGSCLCQLVKFNLIGPLESFFLCHCKRCQKATGSAFAANIFAKDIQLSWQSGSDKIKTFKLPETRFSTSFCLECGSKLPLQISNSTTMIPAGCLDSLVDIRPQAEIFMSSKACWDDGFAHVAKHQMFP